MSIVTNRNLNQNEIDNFTQRLNEIYNDAINDHIPNIKIRADSIELSSHSLALLKEKKSLLRKKYRNKHKVNHDKICYDLKILNIMIQNSIKSDYSSQIESQIKNIYVNNDVFKNIKKITDYKKREQMPNVIYESEKRDVKFVNDAEKVEALANHFEKVHELTNKSISVMESVVNYIYDAYNENEPQLTFSDNLPANFMDDENNNNYNENLKEMFISSKEMTEIIKTRNNKKSAGADKTSNYILKKMPPNFVTTLAIIMNHIINIQYIPSAWKIGVITAISKPNKDSSLLASYRPITQLSVISKILEKKLEMRIRNHCERNNLLNASQFGFQRGKSTEMAACKFITEITKGLNTHKPTIAVLLDFKAAFDTLWHRALIYKMHTMNFDQNIICLVKNYLSNRKFSVRINDKSSQPKHIPAGAPQGGVLSAVFCLLYTNDFPRATTNTTSIQKIMFADDTIIFAVTDKIKAAQKELNEYLAKITNYVRCWKLKLNEQKTEQISIVGHHQDLARSFRKNANKIDLKINGILINKFKKVKYLGVTSNFQFIEHMIPPE